MGVGLENEKGTGSRGRRVLGQEGVEAGMRTLRMALGWGLVRTQGASAGPCRRHLGDAWSFPGPAPPPESKSSATVIPIRSVEGDAR